MEERIVIDFSTNADQVRKQIDAVARSADNLVARGRLATSLDANKASARALTGQLSAKQAIFKLDKQINSLAKQRATQLAGQYNFGEQNKYVKGLIQQNEVLRIQRKILDDNATAMVNLGKNTQWAGRQLVVGFTVPLTIAAGAAMKAFSDLEKEMVKFKRVYGDVTTDTGELDQMAKKVTDLATAWTKYGVAVSDTIQLAATAAGAGATGDELIAQTAAANKLAVLGEIDKQKALKATIAIQSTFNMSNEELGQTINYLNQLENQTLVTLDDMTTAIPKAATVVQGLGGSIRDLGTFMAAMQEGGVSAAEAANALKSGLGSLLNPSKTASEQLDKLGINMGRLWEQSEKNGQGVVFVVQELAKALDGLGQTQKQATIEELFGKHQFARMNALLSNINSGTQAMQAQAVGGAGQLEAAIIAQQELGKLAESNLTRFQSAIEKLKASIAPLGEQIMGVLAPVIEFVTKMIERFNSLPDFVKNLTLGITALAGVIAPIFLMLLGQIQNLIGNGMKFVNGLRNWGQNTKWIAAENLTLADALSAQNAELIAQNKLLTKNEALRRQAATAGGPGGTTGGGTIIAGRPGGRRRFGTGGRVGGRGSSDTVPALLTPGEYVINKEASRRFSGLLQAINSGVMQRLAVGATPVESMAPNAQQYEAKKQRFLNYMRSEADFIEKARAGIESIAPGSTGRLGTFIQTSNSHVQHAGRGAGKKWTAQNIIVDNQKLNLATEKYSGGIHATTAVQAATLLGHVTKNLDSKNKQFGDQIYSVDNSGNPTKQTREYVNSLLQQGFARGKTFSRSMSELILQALLAFREKTGWEFYKDLMDINKEFVQVTVGDKTKVGTRGFSGRFSPAGSTNKFIRRAGGGIVPGSGSKDTVPAMLTPGESVINKQATKRFGPLLEAINSGRIRMLQGGDVPRDPGYRPGRTGQGRDSEARRSMLDELRANIERFSKNIARMAGLSEKAADKIAKQLKANTDRETKAGQTRAAHLFPSFDAQGNKIYDDRLLIGTSGEENQMMEDLSRKKAQAVMRDVAVNARTADVIIKRNAILDKLAANEHLVLKAERDMLQEMIVEAQQLKKSDPAKYAQLPSSLKGTRGLANAAELSNIPVYFPTGKPITERDVEGARAIQKEMGLGPKGTTTKAIDDMNDAADDNAKNTKAATQETKGFGLMMAAQAVTMTGVTDKLGKLGEAAMTAAMALGTLQMMGLNVPGVGGKLGRLPGAGRLASLRGALGRSIKAGGVAGLGVGLGANLIGGVIGDEQGGARDTAGKALSYAGIGAGIGMMLPGGPLTSALGAAIGALAGFAVQTKRNSDALKELEKSAAEGASKWKAIGDEIQSAFGVGTSTADTFKRTALAPEEKEIYRQFIDSLGPESAFNKRIAELNESARRGVLADGQFKHEVINLANDLRGRGLDEQSIETIIKGFTENMDEAVTKGMTAYDAVAAATTANAFTDPLRFIEETNKETSYQAGESYMVALQGLTAQLIRLSVESERAIDQIPELSEYPSLFIDNTVLDNVNEWNEHFLKALEGVPEELRDAYWNMQNKIAETSSAMVNIGNELDSIARDLEAAVLASAFEPGPNGIWPPPGGMPKPSKESVDEYRAFQEALAASSEALIKAGQGRGLKEGEPFKLIEAAATDMKDNTAMAMYVLMQAGEDLSWASTMMVEQGAQATAVAIQAAGNLHLEMKLLSDMAADYEKRIAALNDASTKVAELFSKRDEELETIEDRTKTPTGHEFSRLSTYNLGGMEGPEGFIPRQRVNATLEIDRIILEQSRVNAFAKQFNSMFGMVGKNAVQSFADAEYQIDKIGRRIADIQREQVQPIQDRIEKLNRANELDSRKITALQEKREEWEEKNRKKIEETTKAFEDQVKALEQIRRQNEYIAQQQQANIALADSLSKGDMAGAAAAMVQSAQNQAQYASQLQQDRMTAAQEAAQKPTEEKKNPWDAKIEAVQDRIDRRTRSIQANEDKIYSINQKQIKPLERRAELMQNLLDDTRTLLEYDKQNIDGIDAENQARATALAAAEEQYEEVKNMGSLIDEINRKYQDQLDIIGESVGLTLKLGEGVVGIQGKLNGLITANEDALKTTKATIHQMGIDMAAIKSGSETAKTTVDKWSKKQPVTGSSIETLQSVLTWMVQEGKWEAPEEVLENVGLRRNEKGQVVPKYAGGPIEGSGGQDSVPAMLTPGEFVMRRSAVDRIGAENLSRMNRGASPGQIKKHRPDKFARGGLVTTLDPFLYGAANAMLGSEMFAPALAQYGGYSGAEGVSGAEKYIPSGPVPGLATKEPGPSGMAAERAPWIKPSAIRMMRYVKAAFPWARGTTYGGSGEHGSGLAVDYWPSAPYRSTAGQAQGWELARWAKKWRDPLRVKGVIFSDHSSGYGSWDSWRPYRHSSGSMTDNDRHLNHVHILNYKNGGLVPGHGNADTIPAMLAPGEFVVNRSAAKSVGYGPLKKLNSGTPQNVIGPADKGESVVYNYDNVFVINEADDADVVAMKVMDMFERATRSKVRSR